jgi:hypothetical protein
MLMFWLTLPMIKLAAALLESNIIFIGVQVAQPFIPKKLQIRLCCEVKQDINYKLSTCNENRLLQPFLSIERWFRSPHL